MRLPHRIKAISQSNGMIEAAMRKEEGGWAGENEVRRLQGSGQKSQGSEPRLQPWEQDGRKGERQVPEIFKCKLDWIR